MRRVFLGLLIIGSVFVVAGLAWGWRDEPEEYAPVGPGATYLALGDSLAAGFTVSDPAQAYVARIASGVRALNPSSVVANYAVPGETSGSFRSRQLPAALRFLAAEREAGRRVSPITIDIGGNDARAAERGDAQERREAIDRVESNLHYALGELLAATQDEAGKRTADIVVMNYYDPFGGDLEDEMSPAYWTAELNAAISRAAAAHGVPVADVATAFSGGLVYRYTYITTGDVHANADGHRVIAEQFWRALQYAESLP